MRSARGGRVFILGAGASAFAGFPLARTFWRFMVDHAGVEMGAMEYIDAHLSSIADEAERDRTSQELEALLTRYESGDPPRGLTVEDGRVLRDDPNEKASFLAMHRHGLANRGRDAIGINYLGLLFDLPVYSTYLPDREKNVDSEIGLYMAEEGIMSDPDWPHTGQVQMSPTYRKNYDDEPYRTVWKRIGAAIENASELSVVGYSLPTGDAMARTVLGSALRKNRACKTVSVVNPGDPGETQWPAVLDEAWKSPNWVPMRFEDWVRQSR